MRPVSILAFSLHTLSVLNTGAGTRAECGDFVELRRQRLKYRKLMQLEFDGQNTAKDEAADGKSCRSQQGGSPKCFSGY